MKIKTLQAGGYLSYQPLPIVPRIESAQQATTAPAETKGKHLDDDLLKKLLGKGITVDVMQFSEQMESMSTEYENMSDLERTGSRGKQIRSQLKGNMGTLNGLIRSKDFFDTAMTTVKANKALDEIAVTAGGMFVKNQEGKISAVSFATYAANKDKYNALTNAELAEEREFNKSLVGNTSVFSTLNYGKGMEIIKEEVYKILSHIGSNSTSVNNGSFQSLNSAEIQELQSAAAQGVFKIKSGESIKTNQPHIERAKQVMWTNLSENSKDVLRARAASVVTNAKDIESTAATMAASLLDPSVSVDTTKTYDETASKGGQGGSGGGGSEKDANIGLREAAYSGRTGQINFSQITGSGVSVDAVAFQLPESDYRDKDGKPMLLGNAAAMRSISNVDSAFTADGQPININEAMITKGAYFTELLTVKGPNGVLKLDEAGNKRLAEYNNELGKIPIHLRTPLKKSELMQKYNINSLNLKKLIVAEGASYAPSEFKKQREGKYFQEADNKTVELLESYISNGDGSRNWFDNKVNKHLIFIEAKDLMNQRAADGNSAKLPAHSYDMTKGFNSGNGGYNVAQGTNPYMNDNINSSVNRSNTYFDNK